MTLEHISEQIIQVIREEYEKDGLDQNSNLRNFQYTVSFNNDVYQLTLKLPAYWKFFELGRRPGRMPPVSAIEKWIQTKKLIPRTPRRNGDAWAIAKSIAKKGTIPHNTLHHALQSPQIDSLVHELEEVIINKLNSDVLSEV